MKHSRISLIVLCIVGIFLVVYGTIVILRLLLGDYLFVGGLNNPNYLLLTILCTVPFLLYVLISRNTNERLTEVILTSGLFFLILFVYTNFMLVFSMTEQSQAIEVRLLTTFPMVAWILVVVLHFTQGRNLGGKDLINH
jgi:hypothetical protein